MKLPNGYGGVSKLSGKRRKPYVIRKTTGYHINPITGKAVPEYDIIGYAATKAEIQTNMTVTILLLTDIR